MTVLGLAVLTMACSRPEPAAIALPVSEPAAAQTEAATSDPSLPPTFSAQAAYKHVQHLAVTIGSRPAGTAKEAEAADYIAGELRRYGYTVEKQPFDFEAYRARGATFEYLGPLGAIPEQARPVEFSPGGEVTGRLVPAGIGRPEEFQPAVKGEIALVERGTLTFGDKVANAKAAGAAAVVIYNNGAGEFQGWTLPDMGAIPAVAVSQDTGLLWLRRATEQAPEVRVSVDARSRKIESQNVVAKGGANCRVVVGGHYDSVEAGPGANDNASGTSVTLELARALRDRAARDGLCFIAFGSEELGLWGSRRYVESLSDDQKHDMAAMINLDMVGVGDRWSPAGSASLRELILDAAAAAGMAATSYGSERRGSDHAPFIQAGIPAVFFYRQTDPNYHTADDRAEFVDPTALEAAGKAAIGVIERLVGRGD